MSEIIDAWRDRRSLTRKIREREQRDQDRQTACELIVRVLGYRANVEKNSVAVGAGDADIKTQFDNIIDQEYIPDWGRKLDEILEILDQRDAEGSLAIEALKTRYGE